MILSARLAPGVILIFTIIEVQLIIILAIHAFVWPYRKKIHNVIDLFLFANLAIINFLKLLNFFYAENGAQSEKFILGIHLLQLLFVYIPIIALFLAIIYKVACKVKGFWMMKTKERSASNEDFTNFLDADRGSLFASESYHMMRQKKLESSF